MPRTADVVWLNGSFSVGKTTVAEHLKSLLLGSLIFNPELVGSVLRYTLPKLPDDYQDLTLWRRLTRYFVDQLSQSTEGPVIVPMTITNEVYFEEIIGGLRGAGCRVAHFTLTAQPATIRARMQSRADQTPWAVAQIDRCLAAFDGRARFREYLDADDVPAAVVAERVYGRLMAQRSSSDL